MTVDPFSGVPGAAPGHAARRAHGREVQQRHHEVFRRRRLSGTGPAAVQGQLEHGDERGRELADGRRGRRRRRFTEYQGRADRRGGGT